MMKQLILRTLCLLCICISGNGQTPDKDSLLKLLPVAKDDTAKVQLYIDIGNQYEMDDHKTAKLYYHKARVLSERLGYKKGLIKFITNYGQILNLEGAFDSSVLLNKRSVELAKTMNDPLLLGKCYANTGIAFQYTGIYDSAALYIEKARPYILQTGDKMLLAKLSDVLQNLYMNLKRNKEAINAGEEAVGYFRTGNDPVSLGIALLNLGNNYESVNGHEKSLALYREALQKAEAANYHDLQEAALLGIVTAYMHKNDFDGMKPYIDRVLALTKDGDVPGTTVVAYRALSLYYYFKRNYAEAKKFIDQSLAICNEHNLRNDKVKGLETLSSIFIAMQRLEDGEEVLRQVTLLQDSLVGEDVQNEIVRTEKRFELEKKESQIKLQQTALKQKNTLNYLFGIAALSAILIGLLGYRSYRHKQKLQRARIDELEKEKQLDAMEAVLKGEERERTRLAKDLHDGLGGMLSGVKYSLSNMKGNLILTPDNAQAFERSIDMLDSSIREMRRVAHNMMPEVLVKYGLNVALQEFCNEIDRSSAVQISYQSVGAGDAAVDQTVAVTIYRIIQELVNNAIKHAHAQNMLVQLHISEPEKRLTVTVEDDGKGFDKSQLTTAEGMGWSNIQNRVDFLKGKIDVHSEPGRGTSVFIEAGI
ncbi:ATP-binding protein [Niabella sp.]|uniref:ATP-binding protein n=1 Tax=Niabella sp. TaxID=1962976 RepID=UPI00260CD656|nr:ATP-binding protein [Niabella sp.]